MDNEMSAAKAGIGCLAAALIVGGVFWGIPAALSFESTSAGQIAVVRDGGPFTGKNIKQVIPPGHGATYVGIFSTVHFYPATQSSYTITDDPKEGDQPGVDVVSVPSSDGVQMGIQGTLYFTLNTDPATLKEFDNKFGTRSFSYGGKSANAYDGTEGWGTFMNAMIRPVINNALRQQISTNRCAELISSCALVQNNGQNVNPGSLPASGANLTAVESGVNKTLTDDIDTTLGGKYFTGIRFNITKVDMPPNVQDAVNQAQAAYAQVSQSQAKVVQAEADAKANEARQQGYNACPTCAQIDELKALPGSVTVFAPGGGTGLPLTGPVK